MSKLPSLQNLIWLTWKSEMTAFPTSPGALVRVGWDDAWESSFSVLLHTHSCKSLHPPTHPRGWGQAHTHIYTVMLLTHLVGRKQQLHLQIVHLPLLTFKVSWARCACLRPWQISQASTGCPHHEGDVGSVLAHVCRVQTSPALPIFPSLFDSWPPAPGTAGSNIRETSDNSLTESA